MNMIFFETKNINLNIIFLISQIPLSYRDDLKWHHIISSHIYITVLNLHDKTDAAPWGTGAGLADTS